FVLFQAEGVDRGIEARDLFNSRKRGEYSTPAILTIQPITLTGREAQTILDTSVQHGERCSATVKARVRRRHDEAGGGRWAKGRYIVPSLGPRASCPQMPDGAGASLRLVRPCGQDARGPRHLSQVEPRRPRAVAEAGLQYVPEPILQVRHPARADLILAHFQVPEPAGCGPIAGQVDGAGIRDTALHEFEALETGGERRAAEAGDPVVSYRTRFEDQQL